MTKVGVIGCGNISGFHLQGYLRAGAKVYAVCDVNEQKARARAMEYGCQSFTDYRDLLKIEEIDCVSICVPCPLHYDIALEAIAYGKHILCEKVMTSTAEEAKDLVRKVKDAGIIFQVGYMRRYNPGHIKMKELLSTVGQLQTGYFRVFHPYYKGKALINNGSHYLDTMLWFCGSPLRVCSQVVEKAGFVYQVEALFEMPKGLIVIFHLYMHEFSKIGFRNNGWYETIELFGDSSMLAFDCPIWTGDIQGIVRRYDEQTQKLEQFYFRDIAGEIRARAFEGGVDLNTNHFHKEVKAFVKSVESRTQQRPDVVDGYKVQVLIEAIFESAEKKKTINIAWD